MRRLHACLSGLVVLMPLLLVLFATAFPPTESTLPSAGTTTTNADSTRNATSGIKSLWRSWYGTATHLLDAVHSPTSATPSTSDAAKGVEEAKVVREIQVLAEALKREEYQLEELLEVRAAIKRQSWTWFLDPHIRSLVDAATLKVNNQRRKVESLFDDISLHWRQLKPLHGVRSRMFLSELAVFLLAPILSILDFVASTFSFGLLFFFLLLGPVALFFATVAFSLGVSMLPMIGAGLVVLYTLEFPWFIIQYNPSALEFVVAYAPFLLATYWLASSLGRTLRPVRQFRVVEETVSTPAPAPPTPTRQQRATNVKVD